MGFVAWGLVACLGVAAADEPAPEAVAEEPAEALPTDRLVGAHFERPPSWMAHRRVNTAGLVLGYAGLGVTFTGIGASDISPPLAAGLIGAGTAAGLASSSLLLAGTRGHDEWLESRGMRVTDAGSWTGFGLGVAGFAGGFGGTTALVQGNEEGALTAIVGFGFNANALGVSVTQVYVQGDAMRAVERGWTPTPPAGKWASARGLGIAGAALGWAALPLWTVAGFLSETKADALGVPFSVLGAGGAVLGGPLLAGGVAWERRLLVDAGASFWSAGTVPGYVLAPLGSALLGLEMFGLVPGTFVPGMVVYPLGLGMLTAQLFIHERARGGGIAADLGVVPWGTKDSAGLSITGTL